MISEFDITENIKAQVTPSEKDRENLLNKLNRQLTDEEHLYIFTEYLQTLEKRIYSITENCTLFDLNDLPNELFWKIYYATQLFIRDHDRQKEIDKANAEKNVISAKLQEKIEKDLVKYKKDNANDALNVDTQNLSEYEKLRIGALSQCNYSTFAVTAVKSTNNVSFIDDKRMEKTIYSDSFKHRWKQPETKPPILVPEKLGVKLKDKIKLVTNPAEVNDDDGCGANGDIIGDDDDGDDGDEDENMFNEFDDSNENIELDRFKNQFLKMPKLKLKINRQECDDDDGDDYE
jgi:hypothetical protein